MDHPGDVSTHKATLGRECTLTDGVLISLE